MKRAAVILLALPLLLAADDGWPKKGDTVYLPVALKTIRFLDPPISPWLRPAIPFARLECDNTKYCWYTIPACEPMKVEALRKKATRLDVSDTWANRVFLEGDWAKILIDDEARCRAAIAGSAAVTARIDDRFIIQVRAH